MYLLDSSAIFELIEGTDKGKRVVETMGYIDAATSSVCIYEFLIGYHERNNNQLKRLLRTVRIVNFDAKAAEESVLIHRDLMERGTPIKKADVMIAGCAKAHDATLITCDNDFKKVKGLKLAFI